MKPLPIRLRLTVWYFALFATAALLLSLTSWWMLRHTIDQTLRQDLQERIDDVQVELEQLGPGFTPAQAQAHFDAIYRFRDDGKWLAIADQNGHWIYRSSRMAAREARPLLPQNLSVTGVITTFTQGRWTARDFAAPVTVNRVKYTVETSISMKKSQAMLHTFGIGLLLLTPAMVLIATLAGHLISREALSPVALIVHEAQRIGDRNLDTRLPVSPAGDELSHLSITLNNMLARIDAGFRSVRDFTANASHELRTPLARLRTEIEIALLRPRTAAEYRDSLEHLHHSALDMSSVIDSLLTIARAEAGTEVLRLASVDLHSLIHDAVEEWGPIAARLEVRFGVRGVDSTETLEVLSDRLSLMRLLRVFLDNALKFTPTGGSVTITVDKREADILLAVEDTGSGIAAEHHVAIFDRFFRVHGDTSNHRHGAGLGLSLAAWIAEQHHTAIIVDSALGRGARFQMALRRALPEQLMAAQIIHNQTQSPAPGSESVRMRASRNLPS